MHGCQVWWAEPGEVGPAQIALLNPLEAGRRDRYLREADRDRFTAGVALTRLLVGSLLGMAPQTVPIDRTCADCDQPHGPPRIAVEGDAPHLSISHSGDRVAVAISTGGPVGVDVEATVRRLGTRIDGHVLSPAEQEREGPDHLPTGRLLVYWTRKEAVLKATGDGLRSPMTGVTVTGPGERPRLLSWAARPDMVGRMTLRSLDPGAGHLACLALIDQPDAAVTEHRAVELFSPPA